MKTYVPEYYFDFKCIAHRCSHTCCAGWEIDLDEDTLRSYAGVSGSLGEKLRRSIVREEDGSAHFLLQGPEERCPFLQADGLCRLILELGEGSLSQICTDHPRFRNSIGPREEMGLGICCEAAAELVLNWQKPFRLMEPDAGREASCGACGACSGEEADGASAGRCGACGTSTACGACSGDTAGAGLAVQSADARPGEADSPSGEEADFLAWRQQLADWLWVNDISFADKLARLMGEYPSSLLTPAGFGRLYASLETMDEEWHRLMERMEALEPAPWPTDAAMERRLINLLIYFLFRHLGNALEDGRPELWLAFCAVSTAVVWQAAWALAPEVGRPDADGLADAARRYSAEVEYSDENVDLVIDFLEDLDFEGRES